MDKFLIRTPRDNPVNPPPKKTKKQKTQLTIEALPVSLLIIHTFIT